MHFGRIKIRLRGIGCGKELTRGALKCIENSNKTGGAAIQVFFPALILFSLVPLFFFRLAFPLCGLVTWDKQESAAGAGGGRANSATAAIAASTAASYAESRRAEAQRTGTPYICMYIHVYMYIYVYTYIYIHKNITYIHTYTYIHTDIYRDIYVYTYMFVCMYACMHVCMYVCMFQLVPDLPSKGALKVSLKLMAASVLVSPEGHIH